MLALLFSVNLSLNFSYATAIQTQTSNSINKQPLLNINDYVHLQWRTFNNQQFPSIFDLAQDSQGFIWLATYDGLIRFDGVDFINILNEKNNDIVSRYISNIEISADDSIWFVPFNTGLARLRDGKIESFNINHGLLCDTVTQLSLDKNDKLWYACENGIGYYQDGRFYQHSEHDGSEITALMIESADSIWYGNVDGQLYHLDHGQLTTWSQTHGLPSSNIQTIYRQTPEQILVGTRSHGIFVLTQNNQQSTINQPKVFDSIKDMSIEDIISDKYQILWFGTNKGLVRYKPQNGQIEIKLLGNEAVKGARGKALLTDKQGNIWAGFYAKGLHQMIYPKINVISSFDNIFYAVRCVSEYDNSYWIGTDNAGITIKEHNGQIKQLNTDHGLPSNSIHTLFPDSRGNIWIGSTEGLVKYHNGQLTHYDIQSLGLTDWITAITESHDGSIWIGTINGIAYIKDNKVHLASTDEPRSRSRIRWLAQTQDHTIWAGTYDSVIYLDNGQWQLPPQAALNSKSHRSFYQDADGGMWFGSLVGEGLTWLSKDGQIRSFTTEDGLFDNYMWTITEDQQGYLWMTSDKGISRINRQQLENYYNKQGDKHHNQPLLSTTIGRYEGLEMSECNGSSPGHAHTKAGKLIFPCMVGLVEIDPLTIHLPTTTPESIIDYISSNDVQYWQPQNITLEPQQRDFTIRYTAIGYDNPDKIQFRYRLIGYKSEWQYVGAKRNVSFTNLSAGEYQFQLNAKFYNGQWHQDNQQLTITIKPYFIETWWFAALWIVITILSGYFWFMRKVTKAVNQEKTENTAKIESLSALVGNVTNSLTEPVNRALSNATALPVQVERLKQLNAADEQQLKQLAQTVSGDLIQINQIIELFKQLDIDNYAKDTQKLDLTHLINTIKIDTDINHPNRPIKWTIVQNAGPSIRSYPYVIEQILMLLIDNTLTHGYQPQQTAEIKLSFELNKNQLHINYQDWGKGIDQSLHEQLFLPFNSSCANGKNLGLGMNLVFNLITYKLQGQIKLDKNHNPGVSFLISFPV